MHRASVAGIAFAAVLVGPFMTAAPTAARPSGPSGATTCFGAQADILETPGDDVLERTPARDAIAGLGGDDSIAGAGAATRSVAEPARTTSSAAAGTTRCWEEGRSTS
jgi:hypothetical protein